VATGVARSEFPPGLDRGPHIEAIEYALDHDECKYLRLSNVDDLVAEKSFNSTSAFVARSLELNPNEDAIRRLKFDLEKYHIFGNKRQATAEQE
jgi:hypothetical protein